MVGARVGVALGVSVVGRAGGSDGMGEGSSVGICVWIGERVGFCMVGVEVVVEVGAGPGGKLGTNRCCPV